MTAALFLIQTLFGFYILAVLLRFLLQWVRADFYNPLVQFLVKLTNPPLIPLRRIIPGFMGLDIAAVVLMIGLKIAELLLVLSVLGQNLDFVNLILLAIIELAYLLINIYIWAVIIQAILSWVNIDYRHPAISLLYQLTAPVLRPVQRLLPPMSGLDLSPMVVIIALIFLRLLISDLLSLGGLAY
ncbi:MAG: YggT family protein [Candidatus Competibacteraceae bacterium]|jgi:YggT family protein|nr:YggT family protein [Candidatus Competibacteraceae bacterium]